MKRKFELCGTVLLVLAMPSAFGEGLPGPDTSLRLVRLWRKSADAGLCSAAAGFSIRGISNRVLTPNGDNVNDKAVFKFNNDADLEFSGRIFDLNWALVAIMSPGPVEDSLQWDGKRQGRVVPSGVYIYRIKAEDRIFTGIILVIR